jgi:putative transposase
MSLERRRQMIELGHPGLSVVRQCELLSVGRSGFYYQPVGETAENLALMRLIDAQFLDAPWCGSRQMARHLRGPSQDWGCGGQLAIFAFVLWPRVDAWLGC